MAKTKSKAKPPKSSAYILVVDDDAGIRELLKKYLRHNGYRVTTAENASQARAYLQGLTVDLIILDVMMPGESGFDFTHALRQMSTVPILLLTARFEPEDRIKGFVQGADDYLIKPFEPRELLLRIENILSRVGLKGFAMGLLHFGTFTYSISRAQLLHKGTPVKLTTSAGALLHYFAQHSGKVLSRQQLAKTSGIAERSVDVQINRLRQRFETTPHQPSYIQTVRGKGYVFRPDQSPSA